MTQAWRLFCASLGLLPQVSSLTCPARPLSVHPQKSEQAAPPVGLHPAAGSAAGELQDTDEAPRPRPESFKCAAERKCERLFISCVWVGVFLLNYQRRQTVYCSCEQCSNIQPCKTVTISRKTKHFQCLQKQKMHFKDSTNIHLCILYGKKNKNASKFGLESDCDTTFSLKMSELLFAGFVSLSHSALCVVFFF